MKNEHRIQPSVPAVKKEDARKQTGNIGEAAACVYLEQLGCRIVERNWRCRIGEIDIIASRDGILLFVEVRTRREGSRFGTAAESVDRRKQEKVTAVAQYYMRQHAMNDSRIRFDVIAITLDRSDAIIELKHIEAAF